MSYQWILPIEMNTNYTVLDFSNEDSLKASRLNTNADMTIGKYNEKRFIYTESTYTSEHRCIHMGIDFGVKENTKVCAVNDGKIVFIDNLSDFQDYGPCIILQTTYGAESLYALYAHLSLDSINSIKLGMRFKKGDTLAKVGSEKENGGWPPHLHFQVSRIPPNESAFIGVVSESEQEYYKNMFPDPQNYFGRLY